MYTRMLLEVLWAKWFSCRLLASQHKMLICIGQGLTCEMFQAKATCPNYTDIM